MWGRGEQGGGGSQGQGEEIKTEVRKVKQARRGNVGKARQTRWRKGQCGIMQGRGSTDKTQAWCRRKRGQGKGDAAGKAEAMWRQVIGQA